jgi:Cu(I)/Ag(I) efflux system membrane fusion protein
MKITLIIVAVTLTGIAALANHCCPEHTAKPAVNTPPADRQVYGHYLLIQNALAGDSRNGVPEAANTIAKLARSESKLPAGIADAADKVGKAGDIKAARAAFKELSDALIAHLKTDKTLAEQFYVVHCPMAFNDSGASWLQATKTVSNPYFGASMLRCGVIKNQTNRNDTP